MLIIHNTNLLEETLASEELSQLKQNFKEWKANGSKDSSYFFGKDGSYYFPKLSVGSLRHVHIVPLHMEDLGKWNSKWKIENKSKIANDSRKVSNRALVYTENKSNDFLLITILENAHLVANDKKYMNLLGEIAEDFIIYNVIDA